MNRNVAVIGLGYVGLPVAVAFGRKKKTIGFDINARRIEELKAGVDRTIEVSSDDLAQTDIHFTCDPQDLRKADFHIVAVPTPIDNANRPDMSLVIRASETLGQILKKGDIVVYESTVYPGATEEDCVPVLEKHSGLKFGTDFSVGYSPERINPGDKEHTFTKIKKVVSGSDPATTEIVAQVYGSVVEAGVFRAASIKTAEAAKVIENTQRDLNIALMNELAMLFDKMGIDTLDVLEAAGTKWNFLNFRPGLVGGHCIGVDPYYLTHKAETLGHHAQVILAGRRINDGMAQWLVQRAIREMLMGGRAIDRSGFITVLGLTFKEEVPDIRNSKAADIVRAFQDYGFQVQAHDPLADPKEAKAEYGIHLIRSLDELRPAACVVIAVAHREYRKLDTERIRKLSMDQAVWVDIKGVLNRDTARQADIRLCR
jgi:UDP-N-acetyl-D-glucosamine/UDP-N-acetyl-D-galactosamine dehydrogenase